jgi:hypothetical protein
LFRPTAPFEIAIIGRTPSERIVRFIQELHKHLTERHAPMLAGPTTAMTHMLGFEICKHYTHSDAAVLEALAQVRHQLFCAVWGVTITDAQITQEVRSLDLAPEAEPKVIALCKKFRDLLTEGLGGRPEFANPPLLVVRKPN